MKMVKNRKRDNVAVKIAVIILGALLIVYSLSIIFMLLWGLLSSLKSDNDFMKNLLGLPTINNPEWFDRVNDPDSSYKTLFRLENYVLVIQRFNFPASTSFFITLSFSIFLGIGDGTTLLYPRPASSLKM